MNEIYNFHPEHLSNEQLAELKKIVLAEEERRKKEVETKIIANLSNALREFLSSGAWIDFSCNIRQTCEIEGGTECNTADGDECADVIIDVFDNEILNTILRELTIATGGY